MNKNFSKLPARLQAIILEGNLQMMETARREARFALLLSRCARQQAAKAKAA